MFTAKSSLPSFYLLSSIDQAMGTIHWQQDFQASLYFPVCFAKTTFTWNRICCKQPKYDLSDFFGVYFPPCDQNYSSEVRSVDGRYRGDYAAYWSQNLSIASLAEPNPESMNLH